MIAHFVLAAATIGCEAGVCTDTNDEELLLLQLRAGADKKDKDLLESLDKMATYPKCSDEGVTDGKSCSDYCAGTGGAMTHCSSTPGFANKPSVTSCSCRCDFKDGKRKRCVDNPEFSQFDRSPNHDVPHEYEVLENTACWGPGSTKPIAHYKPSAFGGGAEDCQMACNLHNNCKSYKIYKVFTSNKLQCNFYDLAKDELQTRDLNAAWGELVGTCYIKGAEITSTTTEETSGAESTSTATEETSGAESTSTATEETVNHEHDHDSEAAELEKELGDTKAQLESSTKELDDTKEQLESSTKELGDTKEQLESTLKENGELKSQLESIHESSTV